MHKEYRQELSLFIPSKYKLRPENHIIRGTWEAHYFKKNSKHNTLIIKYFLEIALLM